MRHLAITGIVTAFWIPSIIDGSLIRATPPSRRMSAGTRSSAITATAPASSAIFAWSGVTTSMITPPRNISASPRLTRAVPVVRSMRMHCTDSVWPLSALIGADSVQTRELRSRRYRVADVGNLDPRLPRRQFDGRTGGVEELGRLGFVGPRPRAGDL